MAVLASDPHPCFARRWFRERLGGEASSRQPSEVGKEVPGPQVGFDELGAICEKTLGRHRLKRQDLMSWGLFVRRLWVGTG